MGKTIEIGTLEVSDKPKLVVVALCTARRPIMLKRCLNSLLRQEMPDGWSLAIVVVENDSLPKNEKLVTSLAEGKNVPVYYALEKKQGIPIARNRSVELALSKGADWIVFFDDDEFARKIWLSKYCAATEKFNAEIFRGPVYFEYPKNYPAWMIKHHRTVGKTGDTPNGVTTSNSMVSAWVFREDGENLRFDENMRYTGCSDIDLFRRAMAIGVKAVDVKQAFVREEVPVERSTVRWHLRWHLRLFATRAYIARKHEPFIIVIVKEIWLFFKLLLRGIYALLLSALSYLTFRFVSLRLAYVGMCDLARATGVLLGILGIKVNPYKRIDGH